MQLLSIKDAAKRFNLSEEKVRRLCENGQIFGAQFLNNTWLIPNTALEQDDITANTNDDKYISLNELCKIISISVATGKNWLKLNKLVPTIIINNEPYFSENYIKEIISHIKNGQNSVLKSRRNKKYVDGINVYSSYVSASSKNIKIVQHIIDTISRKNIVMIDNILLSILALCSFQLVMSKHDNTNDKTVGDYIGKRYSYNEYMYLVDSFIDDDSFKEIVYKYPELFDYSFSYEESEDILGLVYISLNNLGSRKITGSYYTPTTIVKKLCNRLFEMNSSTDSEILDPCCGTGNFILQLPKSIKYNYVYGNDTDKISIKIARLNYAMKYSIHDKSTIYAHITNFDYLMYSYEKKFDFIIGNPPWGFDFSKEDKEKIKEKYSTAVGENIESYDVFIEQALHNLNENGILSFVLPEAILNVKIHTPIRSLLLKDNSFQYIEYLGNAFDRVQCPCIILQIKHTLKHFSTVGLLVNNGKQEYIIKENRAISPEYFSFNMSSDEYAVIEKIENTKMSTTLAGKAIFALGIVTGNNRDYICSEKRVDNEMVLKGSDLCKFKYKQSTNYIVYKPESFQQVAKTEYYRAPEKLLYRFICNQLVFAYDNKKTLSLNSCNVLIPKIEKLNIKYIMAILNSRIAQFYFKNKFNSIKVLRSHIEQIPIPLSDEKVQNEIISIINLILCNKEPNVTIKLYEKLDVEIAKIFNINESEYAVIKLNLGNDNLFLY